MKGRILPTDSHVHEFRLLRNRIESEIHAPALVFVTSAVDGDGAGFAAHGLAESLSKTHQRTVLVTSDATLATPAAEPAPVEELRRRASDRVDAAGRPLHGGAFSVVCLSPERVATISRSRVAEMVLELRANNDYVVVDAGNLANNGLGLLLLSSADVTIVAFRAGRSQHDADRLMLDALERAESKVFGVVMTSQESIDAFAERDAPDASPKAAKERKSGIAVLKPFEFFVSRLRGRLVRSH